MKKFFLGFVSFLVALFSSALPAFANSGPVWPYGLTAKTGSNPGTIWVMWEDDGATNQYNLVYGTDPAKYMFGVVNVPFAKSMDNTFEVGQLSGDTTYYFSLVGETGHEPNMSGPVWAKAKGGVKAAPVAAAKVSTSSGPVWPYNFWAATGTEKGTVKLTWSDDDTADNYDLVYGLVPGNYLWGLQSAPHTPMMTSSYTVLSLQSGVRYYFALVAEKDGSVVNWGSPISTVAR